MAFTTADLDTIDTALLAIGTGTRAVEVAFADGRRVKYSDANLKQLQELRGFVAQQVGGTAIAQDPALMSGGVTYAEWCTR